MFSNFSLEVLLNYSFLGTTFRITDSVGLGWILRIWIPNIFPGNIKDADPATTSGDHTTLHKTIE